MPAARIRILDLEVRCQIGVPDDERAQPQRLLIDIEFDAPPARSDDIASTVDYAAAAETAKTSAQARPRRLIETLAHDILQALLHQFPVSNLTVRVRKFSVPGTREISAELRHPGAPPPTPSP